MLDDLDRAYDCDNCGKDGAFQWDDASLFICPTCHVECSIFLESLKDCRDGEMPWTGESGDLKKHIVKRLLHINGRDESSWYYQERKLK
jgi:hypothetical protein